MERRRTGINIGTLPPKWKLLTRAVVEWRLGCGSFSQHYYDQKVLHDVGGMQRFAAGTHRVEEEEPGNRKPLCFTFFNSRSSAREKEIESDWSRRSPHLEGDHETCQAPLHLIIDRAG